MRRRRKGLVVKGRGRRWRSRKGVVGSRGVVVVEMCSGGSFACFVCAAQEIHGRALFLPW